MKKIAGLNVSLGLGLDADMDDYKLVLIRRLAVIALIFICSFTAVNLIMDYPFANVLIDIGGLILMLFVLLMASRRKIMIASLTMTIGLIVAIFAAAVITYFEGRNNGTENLILAMIVVIVAFFDGKLRTSLFVISFVLLIILKGYKAQVLYLPTDSDFIVELIIVAVIACGIYFSTSFFKIGLMRNLDRVYKLNHELGLQKEELKVLNGEKDELIGVVAHDLKNPLHVLTGMLPLLDKELAKNLTEKQAEMFKVMQKSSRGMVEHIDQILFVNRHETQSINVDLKKQDVSILLQQSIDLHKHSADLKNIRIDANLSKSKFFSLVDENCARIVFENLLSNAIKYTPRGESVNLSIEETQSDILIKFQNQGPGISEDDRKLLFKKYQPLYAKPTGSESSTGLGLFTVKKYLLAMNGSIDLVSESSKPTTFVVSLPKEDIET